MESLVERVDEFNAYVEDRSNFMGRKIFSAMCAYGDISRLEKLLTRSIYITKRMIQEAPQAFRKTLEQYRLDWILWVKAPGITDIAEVKQQYNTSNENRVIDGQTALERLVSIGDDDNDSDSDVEIIYPNDEMVMIDGRLRWYQERSGSLYCGLYAIQHVLNNNIEVTQDDLDTLAPNTLSNAGVDAETKAALIYDYLDPNGNYNVRTLVRAIENVGYVTRLTYNMLPLEDIQTYRSSTTTRGIIANRNGTHWYAFRPIDDDKWEVCDSLRPRTMEFPVQTSSEVAQTSFVTACFVVVEPDIQVPNWVSESDTMRLTQLLWQIANPDDS